MPRKNVNSVAQQSATPSESALQAAIPTDPFPQEQAKPEQAAPLGAVLAWARDVQADYEEASGARLVLKVLDWPRLDAEGMRPRTCTLTGEEFRIAAEAAAPGIGYHLTGPAGEEGDMWLGISPRLVKHGPEAVRKALLDKAQSELRKAASALIDAALFEKLAEAEVTPAWPELWPEVAPAQLRGLDRAA